MNKKKAPKPTKELASRIRYRAWEELYRGVDRSKRLFDAADTCDAAALRAEASESDKPAAKDENK